jgi:hypothetical protein
MPAAPLLGLGEEESASIPHSIPIGKLAVQAAQPILPSSNADPAARFVTVLTHLLTK